ncbi:gpW family head-tail joining protein [Paracoccus sp. 22332]|uniref:gpW family head-tail joining protein n=1 Tax=Paracoccus sp. 22332 TaxID=3453913 RepID=UPI003F870C43
MPDETACARLARLRKVREELITGKAVSEVAFGEDRVRYTRADMTALDREIAAAEVLCQQEQGLPQTRTRYAIGVRVRPY